MHFWARFRDREGFAFWPKWDREREREREKEREREREMGAVRGIMRIRHDNSSGGVGGNAVKRTDERTANAAWLLSVARQLGDA